MSTGKFIRAVVFVVACSFAALGAVVADTGTAASSSSASSTPGSTRTHPDPLADCPKGLVCYTLAEDAAATKACEHILRANAALTRDLRLLRSRSRLGRFALVEGLYGTDGPGLTARTGVYFGPVTVGVGLTATGGTTSADVSAGVRWIW